MLTESSYESKSILKNLKKFRKQGRTDGEEPPSKHSRIGKFSKIDPQLVTLFFFGSFISKCLLVGKSDFQQKKFTHLVGEIKSPPRKYSLN